MNGMIQTSHSKFKTNIEPIKDINCLSIVPEPIYFNGKNCDDNRQYLSILGGDMPEIAKDDDRGVYTNSIIPLLYGAVRELKERLTQLIKENEELKIKIAKIKN